MNEKRADRAPDGTIETEEATAEEAQEMDSGATRSRAEGPGMLSDEALEERQRKLRTERLTGGPELQAETEARQRSEQAQDAIADVEPTETEESPD